MDIVPYLRLMVQKNASDLFFSTGAPPNLKAEGHTMPIGDTRMAPGQVRKLAYAIMTDDQIKEFEATMEGNLAISIQGLGRFRVNVFRQRGDAAMVIRYIKGDIPSPEELNLPPILKDLIMEPRGLILVVGSTGSGKSTSLAAMINHRNQNVTGHILTIEDPVEFLHTHKKSVVDQREVGLDTVSYEVALKNAMREAPDVILIGEIRDRATMQHAIAYAETGHLCISTLHANNANQALDRIVNFFPDSAHQLPTIPEEGASGWVAKSCSANRTNPAGSFGCSSSLPTSTITSKHSPFLTRSGAVMTAKCFFSRSVMCSQSLTIFTPQNRSVSH